MSFQEERYWTKVPDTLDSAEKAKLSLYVLIGIPLVLQVGTLVSEESGKKAINFGVAQVQIDLALYREFFNSILFSGNDPIELYYLTVYGIKTAVKEIMRWFGSMNKTKNS